MKYIAAVALLAIIVTMVARLNDLRRNHNHAWQFRAIGLIVTSMMSFLLLVEWFKFGERPSWIEAMFAIGVCIIFITTPHQVPWWKYITKGQPENYGRRYDDLSP